MPIEMISVYQWRNQANNILRDAKDEYLKDIQKNIEESLLSIYKQPLFQYRVYALEKLIVCCSRHIVNIQQHVDKIKEQIQGDESQDVAMFHRYSHFLSHISRLQTQALIFLKAILDVESNRELIEKLDKNEKFIAEQEQLKAKEEKGGIREKIEKPHKILVQNLLNKPDDKFIKPMERQYQLLDRSFKTRYLGIIEREPHRVILSNGKFTKLTVITPFLSTGLEKQILTLSPLNTAYNRDINFPDENGMTTIVVDEDGNMFEGASSRYYHHSSSLAGRPAIFAGLIRTDEQGNLHEVNNISGHYKHGAENLSLFLDILVKRGALYPDAQINLFRRVDRNSRGGGSMGLHEISPEKVIHECMSENNKFSHINYNKWRQESGAEKDDNALFLNTRYKELIAIDRLVCKYVKKFFITTAQQKIIILDQLLSLIKAQRISHPNSARKIAVTHLECAIGEERAMLVKSLEQSLSAPLTYDYESLRLSHESESKSSVKDVKGDMKVSSRGALAKGVFVADASVQVAPSAASVGVAPQDVVQQQKQIFTAVLRDIVAPRMPLRHVEPRVSSAISPVVEQPSGLGKRI